MDNALQMMMRKRRIDAILLSSWNRLDINMKYLADCSIEHSFLICPKKGNSKLLLPSMEYERGQKECKAGKVLLLKRDFGRQLAGILKRLRVKRLGLNLSLISVAEYRLIRKHCKARIVDIGRMLLELRRKKTDREIAVYIKACRMTDRIMHTMLTNFRKFRTEQDAVSYLQEETERIGCELSFPPIVASGKRGSMPHYSRRQRLLKGFCVIDYGLKYKGYCTDMTRTVYVGKPKQGEVDDYNMVLEVQQKAIEMCKLGARCSDVYRFARKRLGRAFTHGLGHGIGLQIHELPNLSPASKERFSEGMVFTVEPGIYLKGKYGIRIEDDVVIRDGKPVVLTMRPRKLLCIRH